MENANSITVQTEIKAPVDVVWSKWITPTDIMQWNNASDDWHTPEAVNDLKIGGKFSFKMAAKDGSLAFDFWGNYTVIKKNEVIEYIAGDGRKVKITFTSLMQETLVTETFEAEEVNSKEIQQQGWQAILNNFKKYVESTL